MTYFNYFTEIEEEFVRRRRSHMLVSPMDWALIETWRQRGIPLRVALRGINESFDLWERRPRRGRKVNTLFYCQQAVEEAFINHCESRVGGAEGNGNGNGHANGNGRADGHHGNGQADGQAAHEAAPFSPDNIRYALDEHRETLARLSVAHADAPPLAETFDRAARRLKEITDDLGGPSGAALEQLDADLLLIEEVLLEGLRRHAGAEELGELTREGERQLKDYRQRMEKEVYGQTLGNWVARRLRERYRVPRLSLFYLS